MASTATQQDSAAQEALTKIHQYAQAFEGWLEGPGQFLSQMGADVARLQPFLTDAQTAAALDDATDAQKIRGQVGAERLADAQALIDRVTAAQAAIASLASGE